VTDAPALEGFQRRYLRGLANPLRPIVHVGAAGVTESVIAATDQALADHELVKVRLHEPEDKHAMADELAARTVGFPAISTGAYGYPVQEAAPVAVRAVLGADTRVREVRFVLFDPDAYAAFERALAESGRGS
jgi:putative YhbY family RNA-binding protein